MKILIFGGTFNPVHVAHLHILSKANEFIKADKILVCIDKIAPWKKMGDIVPYSYRKEMVVNLFDKKIDYSIYPNKQNFVYTYQILKDLKTIYKNDDLYFLVGQDQYEVINTWNEYNTINKLSTIVCYRRGDKPLKKLDKKHIILQDPVFDCSSTDNREVPKIKYLGKKNYQYIIDNNLYPQTKVKKLMSQHRFEHTSRVVETITQIAMGNHFSDKDIWRSQLAGWLHDIAKECKDKKLLALVTEKELNSFPSWHCAHGLAGSRLAAKLFNVKDKYVLDAIANHVIFEDLNTTNKIAKALFCADKLEPARTKEDIDDRQQHLDKCCKNIDKEFIVVYKMNGAKY